MKRFLIAVALAALVATAVSFGTARWFARRAGMPIRLNDAAGLRRELNLTDGQSARITALLADYRAAIGSNCAAHCAARDELSRALDDTGKAQACVARMCAAQAAAEHATLAHILQVREILNFEQRERYAVLINQQLCTACPTGAHHP